MAVPFFWRRMPRLHRICEYFDYKSMQNFVVILEMNTGVHFFQGPAIDTLREVEAFLSANPVEIVTLILEDYVKAPNGLTKVFTDAGLMKYWFPVTSMPQNGEDWPLVSDMVAQNQRLIVFTSIKSKQESEGIAYQWNYMVENQCKKPPISPFEIITQC